MLERVKCPQDLKNLNNAELDILAAEIREFLVEKVSVTGGHLAANLGVVELTIALCLVFDPYKDRIVWDVGHQSYVYKILTGRAEMFDTLRQLGGLSGFPKITESDADAFNSGHSSTSVSAATGFAAGIKLNGGSEKAIAVTGDGAATGGMIFEALNHAGSTKLPVIVILNDNGMSISKNVGGLAKKLKKIRNTSRYFRLKTDVKSMLDNTPGIGVPLKKFIRKIKNITKSILIPGTIFEDLGFKYLGPVDGHSISGLCDVLHSAKEMNEPVIVHINTKKGKGYAPAEKNPDYFHGIGSFNSKTGKASGSTGVTWSEHFGSRLVNIASQNKNIVAITAAMPLGTGLSDFARKYPNRFFDVAIAEQHAVTFAAGLARTGITPIVAVYSTFLQRAYDQIIHDVSLMNLHVVFCIDRCGPVGSDGETHQGVFDIAFMSQVPNMTIFSPSNKNDFDKMLDFAINEVNGPVAIRYPRGEIREFEPSNSDITHPLVVKQGKDVLIAAVGASVADSIEIAENLDKLGIDAAVVDMRRILPLNKELMKELCVDKRLVVSIEDGVEIGGFGQLLESVIERNVFKFAYPNSPIQQGRIAEIKRIYGMSVEYITEKIYDFMQNAE